MISIKDLSISLLGLFKTFYLVGEYSHVWIEPGSSGR
jgi:hypothetical protein